MAACTRRRGCAGSTANWRCGRSSRVIDTRLPTSQYSALLYWARIPERQFPTIYNISHDGSVMYRRDQPLEREDANSSVFVELSSRDLRFGRSVEGCTRSRFDMVRALAMPTFPEPGRKRFGNDWQIASNTKHSQYERLCSIRSHLGHSIAQRYGFTPTPDRSPMFLDAFLVA
jgi:hypothetical protein